MAHRPVRMVRVHCPVAPATLAAMLAGDADAADRDPALARILAVIRADNPLGTIGAYEGVAEIGFGFETFRPGPAADPVLGQAGRTSMSPTVIVTSYAPVDADLAPVLAALLDAHPWETPVIETALTELVLRSA